MTEKSGRVHTSAVSVAILPQADQVLDLFGSKFYDDMKNAMFLFCIFITTTTINNVYFSYQSGVGLRISMLNGYLICITEMLSTFGVWFAYLCVP